MATFTERMIGAARLDRAIFEEVEGDTGATSQAMLVVVGAAVAAGIGAARSGPTAIVWGVVAALAGWCIWAGLTYFIGAKVMPEPQTHADFGQLLRTIGFAATPGLLQVLGILPLVGGLVILVAWLWQLAAMVIAVQQALDYSSIGRAVAVCLIGWLAYVAAMFVITAMLGGAALLGGGLAN